MNQWLAASVVAVVFLAGQCCAQQTAPLPAAPVPQPAAATARIYSPPTQQERFHAYLRHTFSPSTVVEAAVRGGIDMARDNPSQWPQGAQGYGERVGSSAGQIVVRQTTEYLIADAFREDLRRTPCTSPCSESKLHRALDDTFTARKGNDGHRAFSFARLLGPVAGGAVATSAWYPSGYKGSETARQIGANYAFALARNYLRELSH